MHRAKIGDVYAMHLPNGIKIFQWAYHIPRYGKYIRVFDGLYQTIPTDLVQGETFDETDFWVSVGIGAISGAAGNLFRFKSTGAIRDVGKKLVDKGTAKIANGVLNSATSTIKRGFQYIDRGISMIYQYAARAGVNSGFGSTTGCVINGIYSLIG